MENQITIHLTDDEYTALSEEARQSGQEIEALIRKLLSEIVARQRQAAQASTRSLSRQEIEEYLYNEGLIESMPTGEPLSEEEEAEIERLGTLFGQGKPLSEMIIEDRGPY